MLFVLFVLWGKRTEEYLEPCETSITELFAKKVEGF